jgi:phosphoglycolate phosphatase
MPRQKRFEAVLFDLDGTLVETAPDLAAALNHTLRGAGLAELPLVHVRPMIGDGARAMLRRGLTAAGAEPSPERFEALFATLLAHYEAHIADLSRPFPGVVEELERLAEAGLRLGVCTNKPERFSLKLLAALDLARHFQAVVGGDSLAVRKPHGGHVTGTLARLGVGADRAVMVGDAINDVKSARAAGLPVVLVSFGYTAVPAAELGADLLIDHFAELPQALARLS